MSKVKSQILDVGMPLFSLLKWLILGGGVMLVLRVALSNFQLVYALVATLVVAVPLLMLFVWWLNSMQLTRRDYYLSLKENIGFLTYHEGENKLLIPFAPDSLKLLVPSDEAWQEQMREWARSRKAEIMARLQDSPLYSWK